MAASIGDLLYDDPIYVWIPANILSHTFLYLPNFILTISYAMASKYIAELRQIKPDWLYFVTGKDTLYL